jgi:dTDP-4-amino-4,6-dideoxygalactose transaminase
MIKFLDLKYINNIHNNELIEASKKIINSGWYLDGEMNREFENTFKSYIGTDFAIGVANGLDALRIILKSYIEIGFMKEGDEIIVPSNTYIASILAITDNKLIPVLIEPDPDNFNIDFSLLESKINSKTKGIMLVHLYGKLCWNENILTLAKSYNLKIIEDNAQAIGASYYNTELQLFQKTGSLGDAAGFSFYPGKNLGCLGDGGAITTNDPELAKVAKAIANYGSSKKYVNEIQGLNSRLDEIQAAFINVKIKYLDSENNLRREVAKFYINKIFNELIILPYTNDKELFTDKKANSHVWHLFVIRCKYRNELQDYLTNAGIQTLIHYPIPPHKQQAYKNLNKLSLPLTEQIHNEVLSLPIWPGLTFDDLSFIVNKINNFKI